MTCFTSRLLWLNLLLARATTLEEEDIFESDFASTDEEAAQEDVDEGDRAAREEERKERKVRCIPSFREPDVHFSLAHSLASLDLSRTY